MAVSDEIYAALDGITNHPAIYDTKLPDGFVLNGSVLVFQMISDTPETVIEGTIIGRTQLWQVSVRSTDIGSARTLKNAVIAALHGYSGTVIQDCCLDAAREIFETDIVPPEFHIPIDFTIQY